MSDPEFASGDTIATVGPKTNFEPEYKLSHDTKYISHTNKGSLSHSVNEPEYNLNSSNEEEKKAVNNKDSLPLKNELTVEFLSENFSIESKSEFQSVVPVNILKSPSSPITDVSESKLMNSNTLRDTVSRKLDFDEALLEYSLQLQRYQNTLELAQIEKRNAIRRNMALKTYETKLRELENQCNFELMRVRQSLQFLQPLQLLANSWKFEEPCNDFDIYECRNALTPKTCNTNNSEISAQLKLDFSSFGYYSTDTASSSNSSPYLS